MASYGSTAAEPLVAKPQGASLKGLIAGAAGASFVLGALAATAISATVQAPTALYSPLYQVRVAQTRVGRGPPQAQVRPGAPPLGGGQLDAHARLRGDAPPPLRHSRSTFAVRPDVTSPPSAPPPL